MTTNWYRRIFDEVNDNVSHDVRNAIASIDRMIKKIESLEEIEEQMREAAEADIFRMVTVLPETGENGVYYIKLNSSTNKYEEWTWNGSTYDKVGQIEDEVYPTLTLIDVMHLIPKDSPEYDVSDPSHEGWYEEDSVTHQIVESQDTHTYSSLDYSAVDDTAEGYSSKNPRSEGWWESDGQDGYVQSQDTSVDDGKTYYSATKVYTKDYYWLEPDYKLVSTANTGYSSMNPKKLDWYEYDDQTYQYTPTLDQSVQALKDYFVSVQ